MLRMTERAKLMICLAGVAYGRDNNFNLIRMLAASSVLVSHAFPLAGYLRREPFSGIGITLGSMAVLVFFSLSGFLIAKSCDQAKSAAEFWFARFLRLVPALFVSLVVTAYVLGPIVTALPPLNYWLRPYTARYVLSFLAFSHQDTLPGVFATNPFPGAVNGSLWTLRIEVGCYFMAFAVGMLGLYRKNRFWVFLLAFLAIYIPMRLFDGPHLPPTVDSLYPVPGFAAGMVLYNYRAFVPMHWAIAVCLIVATVAAYWTPLFF